MLVLGRKKGQILWIGDIKVTVQSVSSSGLTILQITGPKITKIDGIVSLRFNEQKRLTDTILIANTATTRGGLVKLGVEAPRSIDVDRHEIRIKKIADGTIKPKLSLKRSV